jgi:hypothetical protein
MDIGAPVREGDEPREDDDAPQLPAEPIAVPA